MPFRNIEICTQPAVRKLRSLLGMEQKTKCKIFISLHVMIRERTNNPQRNLISKFLTYVSTQKINSTVIGKGKEEKKKKKVSLIYQAEKKLIIYKKNNKLMSNFLTRCCKSCNEHNLHFLVWTPRGLLLTSDSCGRCRKMLVFAVAGLWFSAPLLQS